MATPHVLVTGASTGIGRATARALRDLGMAVTGSVRRDDDAASLESEGITPVLFDVTDDEAVLAGVEEFRAAAGGNVRGVVANAGIGVPAPIEDLPPERLLHQLDVNVVGVHRVVSPLVDDLIRARGRVVLVSSIAGRIASPFLAAYHTSKFALEGYGDTLRRELHPYDVRVSLVEPGFVATPIWETSAPSDEDRAALSERYRDEVEQRIAGVAEGLESALPPEAVAEVIVEALTVRSPRARYALPREVRLTTTIVPRLPDAVADRLLRMLG